jgi:hypothetical protein
MRDIAQVFRTLWERAVEFNSVPILTPKLIPPGDYGRDYEEEWRFWGEQAASLQFAAACREPISSTH